MLPIIIPLILTLATSVNSMRDRLSIPNYSAASESQIRFAIENNYDDTGPGAKAPESAYNTYKTLEEALVSYIDDPDTKLPESERMKAILRLINTPKEYERYNPNQAIRELPKTVAEYTGYRDIPTIAPIIMRKQQPWQNNQVLYHNPRTNVGVYELRGISLSDINSVKPRERPQSLYKLEDVHIPGQGQVKSLPLPNYYPYLTRFIPAQNTFESNPQHSYSYGNRNTWPQRDEHDSRVEASMRGYYTFTGADGKQRTVHYTDDDSARASRGHKQ